MLSVELFVCSCETVDIRHHALDHEFSRQCCECHFLREVLEEVDDEDCKRNIPIKSDQLHDCLIHESDHHPELSNHQHLVVLLIGKSKPSSFGFLSEAVLQTASFVCYVVLLNAHLSKLMQPPGKNGLNAILSVLKSIWPYSIIRLMFSPSLFVNLRLFVYPCPITSCMPCLLALLGR